MDETSLASYAVDGFTPSRVEKPGTVDELARLVADAGAAGEAVIPWGGGTQMGLGNLPERYDAAVDLRGLNGLVEYEPADMTVIVRAGATVAALQAELARSGQRLPFDPHNPDKATIGGLLATNAVGPIRSSVGGIRDLAIGIRVVEADGAVTKAGGRVVKNVQGFDLVRLHIGALGTLGIIAEVAFKVAPIPVDTRTVAGWFDSLEAARETSMRIYNGAFQPEALMVMTGGHARALIGDISGQATPDSGESALIMARVSGGNASVRRQVEDLTSLLGAEMADGFEVLSEEDAKRMQAGLPAGDPPPALTARATFKPSDAFAFVAGINSASGIEPPADTTIHVGTGTVIANWPAHVRLGEAAASVTVTARQYGVEAVFERCPTALKGDIDVWGAPGPAIDIMRRMKEQFDPKRTLNPGRFAGGI